MVQAIDLRSKEGKDGQPPWMTGGARDYRKDEKVEFNQAQ